MTITRMFLLILTSLIETVLASHYVLDHSDVFEVEELISYHGISRLQCAHRCRLNQKCDDIAYDSDKKCVLLSQFSDSADKEVLDVTRYSKIKVSGKLLLAADFCCKI